jgi:hypothetical protein
MREGSVKFFDAELVRFPAQQVCAHVFTKYTCIHITLRSVRDRGPEPDPHVFGPPGS